MYNNREVSPSDMCTIYVVLKKLDEYDRNILIAYYEIAEGSPSVLARVLDVSPAIIVHRINKIISKVKKESKKMLEEL